MEAMPDRRCVLFLSITALGCAADLATKHWVFQWRGMPRQGNEWWLWEGYVGVETALNTGALFGMGAGKGGWFAALSVLAALGILGWLFSHRAVGDRLLTIALACVMGGILGNLYDRLGLWHQPDTPEIWRNAVRDWILLRYRDRSWPNFNIADSLLVSGAILLMWHAMTAHDATRDASAANEVGSPGKPRIAPPTRTGNTRRGSE